MNYYTQILNIISLYPHPYPLIGFIIIIITSLITWTVEGDVTACHVRGVRNTPPLRLDRR